MKLKKITFPLITSVVVTAAIVLTSNVGKGRVFEAKSNLLTSAGSENGAAGSKTNALIVPGANPQVMNFTAGSVFTLELTNHNILGVFLMTNVGAGNWATFIIPFMSDSNVFLTNSAPPKNWTVSTQTNADAANVSMVASWSSY